MDNAGGGVTNARNITHRTGYDNQPSFIEGDSALLYVSDATGSTDVYRFDIASETITQITSTPQSEFSPTPMTDGKSFSAVRVGKPDEDGEEYTVSQQVWRYDFTGRVIAPIIGTRRVGYHAWINPGLIALFLVGNEERNIPHELVVVDLASRVTTPLAKNIGRTIRKTIDGNNISFVDKSDSTQWHVAVIAIGLLQPTQIFALPKGSEDFCWLPDGSLVYSTGSKILRWNGKRGAAPDVTPVFDNGSGSITRMNISTDGKRVTFVVANN